MVDLRQDALTEAEALRLANLWTDRARKFAAGQLSLEKLQRAVGKQSVRDLAVVTLLGEEPR